MESSQEPRGRQELLGDSGAAACPRPMGVNPPVAGAAVSHRPRHGSGRGRNDPSAPRWGRKAGPSVWRRAVSPGKISIKVVRSCCAVGSTMTLIFHGKASACIRKARRHTTTGTPWTANSLKAARAR
jgi:hypothetical protein